MIFLFLVSILWAFSFGLIKTNLSSIDPVLISTIRLTLAFLIFLPFLKLKKISLKNTGLLMLTGAIQFGLMYICYNYSFLYLKAYEVALFTIFTPLYVTLLNNILLKKISWPNLSTSVLAIIGTAIIVQTNFSRPNLWSGFLLVQLSNICFAFGQVAYKRMMIHIPQLKDQDIFGYLYLGAAMLTAVISLVVVKWEAVSISPPQIWTLVYLGTVASGFGFFLWNYGVRRTNIGAVAIFNNLKIPLSIAISLLIFGEKTSLPHLLFGGTLVVLALGINEFYETKKLRKII